MSKKSYKKKNYSPIIQEDISMLKEPALEEIKEVKEPIIEEVAEPVMEEPKKVEPTPMFIVKVTHPSLRKRNGPGTDFETVGLITDMGIYNIYAQIDIWGRLVDNSWINLDYTAAVE